MNILDYFNKSIKKSPSVIKTLGTITRDRQESIVKLHNLTDLWFYQTNQQAFELRIDFDPKKWDTTNFEFAHKYLKNTFERQKHIHYVMMREWSPKSGNLHYHGIVSIHDNTNQTYMAKLKLLIKRHFGRRSRVVTITYPQSYIPYIYKRYMEEKETRIGTSEIISNYPIVSEVVQGEYPLEKKYTWEALMEYKKRRDENKRT